MRGRADILPKIGSNRFQTSFVIATPNLISFKLTTFNLLPQKPILHYSRSIMLLMYNIYDFI